MFLFLKKNLISLFVVFTASVGASAGTIQQVLPQDGKAAIALEANEKYAVGDILLASSGTQNCPLKVESAADAYVVVDISRCSFKENLKIGDRVERSMIALADVPMSEESKAPAPADEKNTSVSTNTEAKDSYLRFGVTAFYSASNNAKYDDLKVTSSSGTGYGSAEFGLSDAVGIGVSVALLDENSWGFIGSLQLESQRKIKNIKVTGANGTTYGTFSSNPTLTNFYMEANAVYRWEKVYLPFGLNLSVPTFHDNTPGATFTYQG